MCALNEALNNNIYLLSHFTCYVPFAYISMIWWVVYINPFLALLHRKKNLNIIFCILELFTNENIPWFDFLNFISLFITVVFNFIEGLVISSLPCGWIQRQSTTFSHYNSF